MILMNKTMNFVAVIAVDKITDLDQRIALLKRKPEGIPSREIYNN